MQRSSRPGSNPDGYPMDESDPESESQQAQVELPAELEKRLRDHAERLGMDPVELLGRILRDMQKPHVQSTK